MRNDGTTEALREKNANTFVIGDIHGCHGPLLDLLKQANPNPESDRLIFLGDYINRGPESREVLEELIRLGNHFQHTIFLKGNHEVMFLNFINGQEHDLFFSSGGIETLKSYGISNYWHPQPRTLFPKDHINFLENLLPYWADDNFIYVHAGIEVNKHLAQQDPEWLYWASQDRFINSPTNLSRQVIFGHFAHPQPLVMRDKIGVDCGAVYGGRLACLVLPEMRFVSVKSAQYWPGPLPEPFNFT